MRNIPEIPGTASTPLVLCVGTVEGRKNHLALLDAAEALWREGVGFRLRLIGGLNRDSGAPAARRFAELRGAGHPLEWHQNAPDGFLNRSYREAAFTVFPSLMEGFGLPVLESIAWGRPCVCSGENAIAESVLEGGCLAVGEPTPRNLADGMRSLLLDADRLERLTVEARKRRVKSWTDYAVELRAEIFCRGNA
jgi:glycosyltransferase involved in cell wall biosynthesis